MGKVTSIIISGSVKKIYFNAFFGLSNLQKLTIPEGVTFIEAYAFGYCTKLKTLILPKSLSIMDDVAFMETPRLKTIYFRGSRKQWLEMGLDDHGFGYVTKVYFNYSGS